MNLLYVTPNIGNADFLNNELRRLIPDLRMDVSPHLKDAHERVRISDQHDAVLLDPDLSEEDGLSLIIHIRAHRLPLAVIQILRANDIIPPIKALKAGADDYITKQINSIHRLPDILQRAIDRYSKRSSRGNRPLRVLYAGDIRPALQKLGHLHHIKLSGARINDDGAWRNNDGEQIDDFSYDAAVLDDTFSGTQVLHYLKDLNTRAPEIPVLILVPPERDENADYAVKLGAAQCLLKTGEYFGRLLQTLEKTIQNRDLARAKETLLASELRLRTLIETVPAGIVVMACDGTVMAMNRTGLEALDIKSPDWLVGKRFTQLIDSQSRKEFSSFLERICSGGSDSIVCSCRTANETDRSLVFRAVPLRRDEALVTILCSFHANPTEDQSGLDSRLQDFAQQLESSEQERSILQEELKSAETARAELLEAERQDREHLKGITRELEQAKSTIEDARLSAEEEETRHERQLEEERIQSEEKIRGLGERLEDITRELEQERATVEEVRLSADEEKTRHERQLEEERIRGEDKINELGEQLSASEEERLSLREELTSAREARAELSAETEQNQKQLDRISDELGRSQAALDELRLSAEDQRSQLVKQLDEEAARAEAISLDLRERLEDSEKQRSALDQSLKSATETQERLLEERQIVQKDLEITRAQMGDTQKAVEQERIDTAEKHDAERTGWSNKVQELERHLEATADQGNQLEVSLREVQAARERLQREYSESRSRWENEQRSLERRYAELEEAHSEALERARQVEEIHQSGRADEAVKLAALEDERAVLEDALRKAEMVLIKLAEEHEKDISSLVATRSNMERDLQKADERRDELESKLQALQTYYVQTVKEQQAELTALKRWNLEQQKKLDHAEAALAEYKDSVHEPEVDPSRENEPSGEQTVPGEELVKIGLESGQTGTKGLQCIDPREEIRRLHARIERLRSEVQEQLTARKNLSHALQAMAVRHREMIAFRRRDRSRLEALGAELEELRTREIRQPQSSSETPLLDSRGSEPSATASGRMDMSPQ